MEIMKRLQKKAICLMSSVIVIFGFMSCEKSGSDEQIIDADNGKMIEVLSFVQELTESGPVSS